MDFSSLINLKAFIAQIIAFLILFFLLKKFFWKKFLGILDERREKISTEFKNIENNKQEIEKIKKQYEKELANIENTARTLMNESMERTRLMQVEMLNEAKIDAGKIIDNANDEIKREMEKAKDSLKNNIVGITLRATEIVLQENLDDKRNEKLIKDFLENLKDIDMKQ
jgi:F-type H+-transporting ATPase subunit b